MIRAQWLTSCLKHSQSRAAITSKIWGFQWLTRRSAHSSSTRQFKHALLDSSRRQIRLFKLSRTSSGDISADLQHYDINNTPSYRAISYCWGDQGCTSHLRLGDAVLHISPNLFSLFQVHFEELSKSYLWADQVCIDQSCIVERNHQVQYLMEYIYRQATEVVAWLGASADCVLAGDIVASSQLMDVLQQKSGDDLSRLDFARAMEDIRYHCGLDAANALSTIVTQPYWTRHWIVQEVFLAHHLVLACGTKLLPWHGIIALWAFGRHEYRVVRFETLSLQGIGGRMSFPQLGVVGWSVMLEMTLNTQCRDLRDKVYGTQNLLNHNLRCSVDYTKPVLDVYIDSIWAVLQANDYLIESDAFSYSAGCLYLAMGMGLIKSKTDLGNVLYPERELLWNIKAFVDDVFRKRSTCTDVVSLKQSFRRFMISELDAIDRMAAKQKSTSRA